MTYRNALLGPTAVLCLLLTGLQSSQGVAITPAAGTIANFSLHNLDATSLDPRPPVTVNLKPGASDSWTVMLTNGSTTPWTDFHVEILGGGSLAADLTSVRATGFSGTSPATFTNVNGGLNRIKQSNLPASMMLGTVAAGNAITLTVGVTDRTIGTEADYYLGVRATNTPARAAEPGSLALLVPASSAWA